MTTKVPNSMLVSPGTGGGGGTVPFAVLTTDYGAVGDGVTDDTGAITAADVAGEPTVIPRGTYKLNSAVDVLTPFIGVGVAFDYSGVQSYIRNFTDIGRKAFYKQIYRDGEEYTGTPTTYTNLFEFSGFHLDHFSTLGYQQKFTDDSGGRTMQPGFSVNGDTVDSVLDLDFSSFGPMPYTVPELQAETLL